MIVIEPPSGDAGLPAVNKASLSRFLARARSAAGLDGEVTVLLADDARLKELNRTFRRKNKPTDVLSFPAGENAGDIAGDLAISVETAARQAGEHGHTLDLELRILVLHGVLHLAGHDHEADSGEMRTLENALRARLKLPAGLIERVQPATKALRAVRGAAPAKANAKVKGKVNLEKPASTVARKAAVKPEPRASARVKAAVTPASRSRRSSR